MKSLSKSSPPGNRKSPCQIIGRDGNIFNLMGVAAKCLRKDGRSEAAMEMTRRITSCGSYEQALQVIQDYVEVDSEEKELANSRNLEQNESSTSFLDKVSSQWHEGETRRISIPCSLYISARNPRELREIFEWLFPREQGFTISDPDDEADCVLYANYSQECEIEDVETER